ncbi:armadillo-type protein [Diplogelasinospora grovesii]|uniref:Armadillo-type protein n=1 Tax=Diplogelasinospora grovesii TaxID=303347 RepID=A0AAN6NC04_9PEZI|nr:armadillo-type protein [Diplogelasinospora grovesii]
MAPVGPSPARTEFFQQLKPICVPLTQLALRPSTDKAAHAKEILNLIDRVADVWTAQASKDASILDDKLADYCLVPLSHVIRGHDQYPVRVIEAAIKCLRVLIEHGFKANMPQQLAQQLLIFLSLLVGGVPGQQPQKRELPEETVLESYKTLGALITVTGPSIPPSSSSEHQILPALRHAVSVVLDGITEGGNIPSIQLEALNCLHAVFATVRDNSVLATFLPGTVSTLTKLLSLPLSQRTQKRVLVSGLEVLRVVLVNVLGDIKTRGILKQTELQKAQEGSSETDDTPPDVLSPPWLRATAAQVKIALSSVLKLRKSESADIQSALLRLCIGLLDECHGSLAECQSILVESAMMLESEHRSELSTLRETSLQDLASIYPELADVVRNTMYNWITGLPRVMQSADETVKQLAIRNILRGSKLVADLGIDSSILENSLGDALRDSVITLIKTSKPSKVTIDEIGTTDMVLAGTNTGVEVAYRPVLLDSESQKTTRNEINTLISKIGSSTRQAKLAASMLSSLRDSEGADQIASYWLAFELLKASYAQSSDIDAFFDLSGLEEPGYGQDSIFQELYDFSATVLTSHSDATDTDWRVEAIALEVVSFSASRSRAEFRPELIDILYPVVTFLGSQVPQLRSHAITTLNTLASSCGYTTVSELVIDNVDYMINSVSLRLNTFDISPASTKVLVMMVRLTGPRLIPYLDDVVAALFAALDNYHGYPVFVENLFAVLSEIVTQGVKSDTLLLESSSPSSARIDHRKRKAESAGIDGILEILAKRQKREQETEDEDVVMGHPKEAWGPGKDKSQAKSLLDQLTGDNDEDNEMEEDKEGGGEKAVEEAKKTPTPTYSLLSRVVTLTQHYLTSPTPTLRKSLLDLLGTVAPALGKDEDEFLPLVHALWPVVISRLHDPEPFVVIAACNALAGLCAAAGDFLTSRFKTAWSGDQKGGGLGKWFAKVKKEAGVETSKTTPRGKGGSALLGSSSSSMGGSGGILIPGRTSADGDTSSLSLSVSNLGLVKTPPPPQAVMSGSGSSGQGGTGTGSGTVAALGKFAQASQIWAAAVGLLTAIVTYVRVDDDMFDQMLDLVVDILPKNEELRRAFETVNADAVWLAMYEQGQVEWMPTPVVVVAVAEEGVDGLFEFVPMEVNVMGNKA